MRFPPAPSSTIKKDDATAFVVKDATVEGVCPQTCSPGPPGCGWSDGDLTTFTQTDWGAIPNGTNAATLLANNYNNTYASTMGLFEVGIVGAGGFSMLFTGAQEVLAYIPAVGPPGPLDSDLVEPSGSTSGAFGGDVVALRLNIDFSDAGVIAGTSGLHFGDLALCGFATLPALNGLTVRQFSNVVNTMLGGGVGPYSFDDMLMVLAPLNGAFSGGDRGDYVRPRPPRERRLPVVWTRDGDHIR